MYYLNIGCLNISSSELSESSELSGHLFKFSFCEKLLEVCRILRFYQKPEALFSGVLLKRCRHGAFVFAGILKSWSRAAELSPAINTNKGLYKCEKFAA